VTEAIMAVSMAASMAAVTRAHEAAVAREAHGARDEREAREGSADGGPADASVPALDVPPALTLVDGSTVRAEGGGVAICDPEGRVVVRYEAGRAEVSVPEGDLVLSAPRGRVRVEGAEGVELSAPELTLRAGRVVTHAREIVQSAERFEVAAGLVVERAREVLRDAVGLVETRMGRARTLVSGAFSLRARRTDVRSEEETSIDGSRVLLG
jgi:hypothetical protein